MFPEEVRQLLPSNAVDEIRQAGKALAFDMFTAYAFHMMRAAEILILGLVRDYYPITLRESQRNLGQDVAHGGSRSATYRLNLLAIRAASVRFCASNAETPRRDGS